MSKEFKVVIPARYASSRFPGKPLADIHGKPMLQHVYERALEAGPSEIIIATDSVQIGMVAENFGALVCMTSDTHASGTDRLGEVVEKLGWPDDTVVVNVQGDEPLLPAAIIRQVAVNLMQQKLADCATLVTRFRQDDDIANPNLVKVVFDSNRYALYFSRAPIPCNRDADVVSEDSYHRHIGLYAYRAGLLRNYGVLQSSPLEALEKLEQLRLLWNGLTIHVDEAVALPGHGVDTPADLEKVRLAIAP